MMVWISTTPNTPTPWPPLLLKEALKEHLACAGGVVSLEQSRGAHYRDSDDLRTPAVSLTNAVPCVEGRGLGA